LSNVLSDIHTIGWCVRRIETLKEETTMAWKKPVAKLIACGMEINMYGPAEDERRSDELF
jgi:hypothetical protein